MSISTVLFTATSLVAVPFSAVAANVEVPTPVTQILAPSGFTEADNAVVVLNGFFPNTCYEVKSYQTFVDTKQKEIIIDAKSTTDENALCALRTVPFSQLVELGPLAPGEYKVSLANNADLGSTSLVISPREFVEDEPDFAYVREAKFEIDADGRQFLNLSGDFPFTFVGCALMGNIGIQQIDEKMLIVEPTLKLHSSREGCENWSPRFSVRVELHDRLPAGPGVLFVKSADGKSLVRIISVAH